MVVVHQNKRSSISQLLRLYNMLKCLNQKCISSSHNHYFSQRAKRIFLRWEKCISNYWNSSSLPYVWAKILKLPFNRRTVVIIRRWRSEIWILNCHLATSIWAYHASSVFVDGLKRLYGLGPFPCVQYGQPTRAWRAWYAVRQWGRRISRIARHYSGSSIVLAHIRTVLSVPELRGSRLTRIWRYAVY